MMLSAATTWWIRLIFVLAWAWRGAELATCNGGSISLACSTRAKQFIHIQSAFFGRYGSPNDRQCFDWAEQAWLSTFGGGFPGACSNGNTLTVAQGLCENRASCTLPASTSIFGGSCTNRPVLDVQWECIPQARQTGDCTAGGVNILSYQPGEIVSHSSFDGSTPYSANQQCQLQIQAGSGEKIALQFSYFDLEGTYEFSATSSSNDYVEIDNGQSTTRYSGRIWGTFQVQSKTNTLGVKFVSNSNIDKTGFLANYRFVGAASLRSPSDRCGMATSNMAGASTGSARAHDWPWAALIRKGNQGGYFTGALITSQLVLATGAGLMNIAYQASDLSTLVASFGRQSTESADLNSANVQVRGITKIIAETADPRLSEFILLQLDIPVVLTKEINQICLPATTSLPAFTAKQCWSTGWRTASQALSPNTLQQEEVQLVNPTDCNSWVANNVAGSTSATNKYSCATSQLTGCENTVGELLQCQNNDGIWTLYGVKGSIEGRNCTITTEPVIYHNTTLAYNWILTAVSSDTFLN